MKNIAKVMKSLTNLQINFVPKPERNSTKSWFSDEDTILRLLIVIFSGIGGHKLIFINKLTYKNKYLVNLKISIVWINIVLKINE